MIPVGVDDEPIALFIVLYWMAGVSACHLIGDLSRFL